ncbi:SpoIIE family protein phosphatase [Halocola ammonii]
MPTQFKDQTALEQKVASLEQMLEMTTSYMSEVESDLKDKKERLETYNKQFNRSLSFASIIQSSIQPAETKIRNAFKDAILINKPRDVIGGDLVWLRETEKYTYLASMDCTGHGVPGALLSMVASFSMDAVIDGSEYSDPKELLTDFNNQFCSYFKRHEVEKKDLHHGLDIGVIIHDKVKKTLSFNGTRQSLIYTDTDGVHSLRGDSAYIGNKNLSLKSSVSVPLGKSHRYFLFSDGIVDQFGGPRNKKFLARRLRELLFKTRKLNLREQKEEILQSLDQWMEGEEQTDDILLIGFELA